MAFCVLTAGNVCVTLSSCPLTFHCSAESLTSLWNHWPACVTRAHNNLHGTVEIPNIVNICLRTSTHFSVFYTIFMNVLCMVHSCHGYTYSSEQMYGNLCALGRPRLDLVLQKIYYNLCVHNNIMCMPLYNYNLICIHAFLWMYICKCKHVVNEQTKCVTMFI